MVAGRSTRVPRGALPSTAMPAPVFVGSAFVAQYPGGGGNFWVPLQYLLGLRALGVDAWWLELLFTRGDEARDRACVDWFLSNVRTMGVAGRVVLVHYPASGRDDAPGPSVVYGMTADELSARQRDGMLLNLANSVTGPGRAAFARTALLDLDPGTFQLWARECDLGVGAHDVHLTIGQNLGAPDSPVPLAGVPWVRVWPSVHLDAWPPSPPPAGAPYTTVTHWWNGQYAVFDGETYDCNKRSGFLPLLPLARRTRAPLELAANLHPEEREDRRLLARSGWRLADPADVAGTPAAFRRYVQASRGEVSAAKPAYVKARAGWVSDRTLCYLASARPCVLEATGAEAHLPVSAGLRWFGTLDEAADALAEVEGAWPAAARAARALAEEVFSTRVVLPGLLRAAGA